jgi:hypothetical protein
MQNGEAISNALFEGEDKCCRARHVTKCGQKGLRSASPIHLRHFIQGTTLL